MHLQNYIKAQDTEPAYTHISYNNDEDDYHRYNSGSYDKLNESNNKEYHANVC